MCYFYFSLALLLALFLLRLPCFISLVYVYILLCVWASLATCFSLYRKYYLFVVIFVGHMVFFLFCIRVSVYVCSVLAKSSCASFCCLFLFFVSYVLFCFAWLVVFALPVLLVFLHIFCFYCFFITLPTFSRQAFERVFFLFFSFP